MDKILKAREERSNLIKSWLSNDENVVVIKANIIGVDKNPYYSIIIINVFFKLIKESISISRFKYVASLDGDFYIINTKDDSLSVKLKCINLEEEHPLGRLVDIDVYNINGSISRKYFNKDFRKCLVCGLDAVICTRNKSHSFSEVKEKENEIVINALRKKIKSLIDKAITLEARLDPKFGLVTIKTNGSHKDMNFNLLMKSKDAIIDDLVEMFLISLDIDVIDGFKKARDLGKNTEVKMYEATNNINTYKGLIFILGIVLVALGYCLKNRRTDLFNIIKIIGNDLLVELNSQVDTFGKLAYTNYGFLGARGEVYSGLENVRKVKKEVRDFSDETLTMTLINLVRNVEDTVLLKRSKTIEKYNYYKNLVGNIEVYDYKKILDVTKECINNNISFGGSADLLVATIFIRLVEEEIGIIYE